MSILCFFKDESFKHGRADGRIERTIVPPAVGTRSGCDVLTWSKIRQSSPGLEQKESQEPHRAFTWAIAANMGLPFTVLLVHKACNMLSMVIYSQAEIVYDVEGGEDLMMANRRHTKLRWVRGRIGKFGLHRTTTG